jgi:hypothetical protein
MLAQKYYELTSVEKVKYIGELIHACQSSDIMFSHGEEIIKQAKLHGVFDKVTILPNTNQTEDEATE